MVAALHAMPVFFLVLACALWGVSFPIIKALDLEQSARLPGASKVFLASWLQMARFALAALLMAPLLLHQLSALPLQRRLAYVAKAVLAYSHWHPGFPGVELAA